MSYFINSSNVLKNLVTEVIYNSRPLDKFIESFFRGASICQSHEKESLYKLLTFAVRYWITLNELYRLQFPKYNLDFHEILHIQHVLERHISGKLVCKDKYEKQVLENFRKIEGISHIRESFPEWLYNVFTNELGGKIDALALNLNQSPSTTLRANRLKTSPEELLNSMLLKNKAVQKISGYPDALLVKNYFDIFKSSEFQDGLFEMQDAGSQTIAPFLAAEPGMRVIDACAGNGGKTLHLSGILNNKGKIIALDIAPYKLEVLKKRMKRAGSFNIETRPIDSLKTIKRMAGSADRLLLDVPCSGTGVLKRNPDIKYHLTEEQLQNLYGTQQEILDKYSCMVARGGILVYSTCSILRSENQEQVRRFIEARQGDFELMAEKTVSPQEGFDGFYMARLKRCH